MPGQPADRLPHRNIISAQMLKPLIRSAEFVNRFCSKVEKHSGSDRLAGCPRDDHKTLPGADNASMDAFKKSERLRRKTMFAARSAMQAIKCGHGIKAGADFPRHARLHGLAKRTLNRAVEPAKYFLLIGLQLEGVPVKAERCLSVQCPGR